MKPHLCNCYLLERMKWKLTWECLGIESLQVGTTCWIKQDEVGWEGECLLPLMLKANADYSACVSSTHFRSLLLCKLSGYRAGQDCETSLNPSADRYLGIYSPSGLCVQFKRSLIFKIQFSLINLYIYVAIMYWAFAVGHAPCWVLLPPSTPHPH